VVDIENIYDLTDLDAKVEAALSRGDERGLDVLAYGEISVVLRVDTPSGPIACKRLPIFENVETLRRYRRCLERYLGDLRGRGVQVVPTDLCVVARADGSRAGYCVQPLLDSEALATRVLRRGNKADGVAMFRKVVDAICAAVSPRLGLDAQLSNWTYVDGQLTYLDVTTPLVRDVEGNNELDADLFLAALPRPLRVPVKRWVLADITDKYHNPRGVIVDAISNLHKEQLTNWIPAFIGIANEVVSTPITAAEVARYYKFDARTWAALLWLRHADRAWHRRVLQRPYPFLLPKKIDRHV